MIKLLVLQTLELFCYYLHLSSTPVFSGVRVTRSLVLYVCFVDRCLSLCTFSFDHCVFCFFLRYADYDYLPLVSSNSSYWQYDVMSFLLLGCHLILLDRNRINFGL
jgi:hypothetical protein